MKTEFIQKTSESFPNKFQINYEKEGLQQKCAHSSSIKDILNETKKNSNLAKRRLFSVKMENHLNPKTILN
jgi:hypothetical protein